MTIAVDKKSPSGIYLRFDDGKELALTRTHISAAADRWLNDPNLLPEDVQAAVEFEPCAVCPARYKARICHALGPVLPCVDQIDKYDSFTPVTVFYRDSESTPLQIKRTTMQRALQYVTLMAITEYCEVGQQYRKFFKGLSPIMEVEDFAKGVVGNIVKESYDDGRQIEILVEAMAEEIRTTCECQVKRIRLVCRKDQLVNAYVNIVVITDLLRIEAEALVNTDAYRLMTVRECPKLI